MYVTEKTSKLGKWMITIACALFFLGYWALLLEPIQAAYINAHKTPSFIGFSLFALADGFIFGALTWVGYWLTTWSKGEVQKFAVHEFLDSKNFRIWTGVWMALILLFTLLWRGGNF